MKVAIVGAGIAGLTCALRLSERHDVTLFEREPHAGGKIRSQRVDDFLFEWGPHSFLSSSQPLVRLVDELALEKRVQPAAAASHRYIYYGGRMQRMPSKPPEALTFSLLSAGGKARALREIFAPVPPEQSDESVDEFFRRRFGAQVAERVVAPALLGITGGDAATTEVGALFPRLPLLERSYGSVIRGAMRNRRKPGRLLGFGADGMSALTDALAARIGDRLRLDCAVNAVRLRDGGWHIDHRHGRYDADAVVLCTPSHRAAELVERFDATLAALLRQIEYAPMRVAGIAFRKSELSAPPDGLGFLAARGQGIRILGALYTSSTFPAQAPPESLYLRVFLGGSSDPQALDLSPQQARATVLKDLATTLGIRASPIAYHEVLWRRAIPQYAIGHGVLVTEIERRAGTHAGLILTGNAYRGVSLSDTVDNANACSTF